MYRILLAVILASVCAGARADEWIGPFTVKYIESSNDQVYFMNDWGGQTAYPTPYSCNNAAIYFPASLGQVAVSRALTIGMAAQLAGVKVKFLVTGCSGYVTARAIAIDPNF